MNNLSRTNNILRKINLFGVGRRKASTTAKDVFHQPDVTPEELSLIKRRIELRKALRAEYLRKVTDPHSTEPYVFDPCMQRYYSMFMTMTERFVPTFKNWCVYMCSIILPIVLYAQYLRITRQELERKYRSGEIPYHERLFRYQ